MALGWTAGPNVCPTEPPTKECPGGVCVDVQVNVVTEPPTPVPQVPSGGDRLELVIFYLSFIITIIKQLNTTSFYKLYSFLGGFRHPKPSQTLPKCP